jgi:hypothetical protein
MLAAPPATNKTQYIRHPAFDNLYVIPYVRGRLVFAELAARAISEGTFDVVAIDLPTFLQNDMYFRYAVSLFPVVSALMVRDETSELVRLPFSPSDAACAAVAATGLAGQPGRSIELRLLDDSAVVHYHQHLAEQVPDLDDDYRVFTDGLDTYFQRPMKALAAAHNRLPGVSRFYLDYRAAQLAERLTGVLAEGKRTLFVCNYRLWRLVSPRLHTRLFPGASPVAVPWPNLSAAFVLDDPLRFWALGLLDDYPAIVHDFYQTLTERGAKPFDKVQKLESILLDADSPDDPVSPRSLLSFSHYLRNRLCARRRWVPEPLSQLHDSALCCVGTRFANSIARRFLRYPAPSVTGGARFLRIANSGLTRSDQRFEIPEALKHTQFFGLDRIPQAPETFEERLRLASRISPRITKVERDALLPGDSNVKWAVAADYHLHDIACANARRLAAQRARHTQALAHRMRRGLEGGVDVRATLSARARNDPSVYVRPKRNTRKSVNHFDEGTPTVFLFEEDISGNPYEMTHDSNVTQRRMEMNNTLFFSPEEPPPDHVYSVCVTYRSDKRVCDGHIQQLELTSLALLYTRHMGLERYAAIVRRAERHQCRTHVHRDRELLAVSYSERSLAWAIKYAEDSVIVVARGGWSPSARLSAFAEARGVTPYHVPLSRFAPDFIDRLRIKHSVSTALKKYPGRDEVVARFVP